jgi:hypothetical protein
LERGLERQDPQWDRISVPGLIGGAKYAVAREWLVQQGGKQVIREVSVCSLDGTEITRRKQMEDKPVVTLAQQLSRNTSGLLGD